MVNIITPSIHPENLKRIYETIKPFGDKEKVWWYIVYDLEKGERMFKDVPWVREFWLLDHCWGNPQRNYALNLIKDGWCYFLDDDNVLHPKLVEEIESITDPNIQGILFRQLFFKQRFARVIHPKQCCIDQAQFALKRELIGDKRYELGYTADGKFIEELYRDYPEKFLRIEKILCFYNYLR